MKKLLVAVATMTLVAMSASAAKIKWSSDALDFGGTSLKSAGVVTYLVYLDDGAWSDPYSMTASMTDGSFGTSTGHTLDKLNAFSKATSTYDFGTTYGNDDVFGLVFKYVNPEDGKTYWNLSTSVNTLAGLDPTDATVEPAKWNNFAVVSTVKGEAETISAGDGWVTFKQDIPEPTTYALIGVAAAALALRKRFMKK